jgi:hypothetical protein
VGYREQTRLAFILKDIKCERDALKREVEELRNQCRDTWALKGYADEVTKEGKNSHHACIKWRGSREGVEAPGALLQEGQQPRRDDERPRMQQWIKEPRYKMATAFEKGEDNWQQHQSMKQEMGAASGKQGNTIRGP